MKNFQSDIQLFCSSNVYIEHTFPSSVKIQRKTINPQPSYEHRHTLTLSISDMYSGGSLSSQSSVFPLTLPPSTLLLLLLLLSSPQQQNILFETNSLFTSSSCWLASRCRRRRRCSPLVRLSCHFSSTQC
jgi:hypothetical protein